LRAAGIVDHAAIGGDERPLEAEAGETLDRPRDGRNDRIPEIRAVSPDGRGRKRIHPEPDVAGGRIEALALDEFRDVDRGHARLRTDLELDADAGVEVNVLQHPRNGLRAG